MAARRTMIDSVDAIACVIPDDDLDSTPDTTIVVVTLGCGGVRGVGYTFADATVAQLIRAELAPVIRGRDPLAFAGALADMTRAVRKRDPPALAAPAISAVDMALWDLKARVLGLPLCDLLGPLRERIPVYGSDGPSGAPDEDLEGRLRDWAADGMAAVTVQAGREPWRDAERVRLARDWVGDDVDIYVDGGERHAPGSALAAARVYDELGVAWFADPLPARDVAALHDLRAAAPPGIAIASGSSCRAPSEINDLLQADAVDLVQADATRCLGITGFLAAAELCRLAGRPLSARNAPSVHLHLACTAAAMTSMEWACDHARVEEMLFDGVPQPSEGMLEPDFDRPGIGLEPRFAQIERWAVRPRPGRI
jgi:L-alanine-DL-glutamate epimerase-like enolase superfamily enzyme